MPGLRAAAGILPRFRAARRVGAARQPETSLQAPPRPPSLRQRLVLAVYEAGLLLFLLLSLPVFLWRDRRTGKYRSNFRQRLGHLPDGLATGGPTIWVHAVSVGEVLAARPLLLALKERFAGHRLLLSTTTLTGHAVAQASARGIDGLFYAPFDFRRPVRRVLDALRPELLVLVETELWPNLIHAARRRGVRVAVVNGRLSPRSFPRYRRVRALLRHVLAEVDVFLMQAEPHARRLIELGGLAERVRVSGNLKFDAPAPAGPPAELAARLDGSRPLIVAGSTVEGEEELVLQAFAQVRARHPEAHLLIAPRHPERFARIPELVEAAGWPCLRRSALEPGSWGDEVVVLDTLGELASVYALARVVFVGGSLVPKGGHNVLEPALFGRAVVVGPHMQNFQEIAEAFLAERALEQVRSGEELGPALLALLEDDARREALGRAARALVERNRGAVARTVEALAELLS